MLSRGEARTRCRHAPLSNFALLLFLFVGIGPAVAIWVPSTSISFVKTSRNMAPKDRKDAGGEASSSVLRELKDTVRSQASEIERLKKELSAARKSPPTSSGGGHASSHAGAHHGAPSSEGGDILDYGTKPFHSIASERVGWLGIFLVSLSFTALIMNGFEHTLSKQIELAYFVPLMAGHGGNTGGQAVGTVLSALSAGAVTRDDALRVISKEALSGLAMGTVLGALVGSVSHYVMGISVHVATVVSVTFPLLSTIAAFLGGSLPFACVILGLDPAVIAAPAMTSFVDVSGLLCYFLIANRVFRMFGLEL